MTDCRTIGIDRTCPRCNGGGEIGVWRANKYRRETCPKCQGTGVNPEFLRDCPDRAGENGYPKAS